MTASSSVARTAPASTDAAMRAAVLRPIMSKYSSTDIGSERSLAQMSMYWPSHSARHVSSWRRISRRTLASGEAQVGQSMEGLAAQGEEHVAGVDRLRDAVERPQSRAVAALGVAVLDVVVDQAEVVAELHGRGAGQGRTVVARDRGVGEQPEQRPHPLAGRAAAVEAEVVAAHLVEPGGGASRSETRRRISRSVSGDEFGEGDDDFH